MPDIEETARDEVNPAVVVDISDLGDGNAVDVTYRLSGEGWNDAFNRHRARLEYDHNRQETTGLAVAWNLRARLMFRANLHLNLSAPNLPRRAVRATDLAGDLLADIAPEEIRPPLSRFLHDGLFLELYREFSRQCGVNPPPDLTEVDVEARPVMGADALAPVGYEITFRTRLPRPLVQSGDPDIPGDDCDLTMTIQVASDQVTERSPQLDLPIMRVETRQER